MVDQPRIFVAVTFRKVSSCGKLSCRVTVGKGGGKDIRMGQEFIFNDLSFTPCLFIPQGDDDYMAGLKAKIFFPHVCKLPVDDHCSDDQCNRDSKLNKDKNIPEQAVGRSRLHPALQHTNRIKGRQVKCRITPGKYPYYNSQHDKPQG